MSSWLDYCICLLFAIADGLMRRWQAVRNAAARLITGTSRRDHITPVACQLHWLPVRHRVEFKLAVLVFKALQGLARQYLWLMTANSSLPLAAVNYERQTPLHIVRHYYMRHPTHPHSSWRSIIHSRWTTSVDQSTCRTSSSHHFLRTVSSSAKDAFFELSQSPSDFSF